MSMTLNLVFSTATSVRLTPSTATDPFTTVVFGASKILCNLKLMGRMVPK